MAALDLPINDIYLSHLHQVRNARKAAAAARAASSPPSLLFNLASLDEMSSTTPLSPSTSTSTVTVSESSPRTHSLDIKASDTAVLSQYPSALIRLLVLLAPIIDYSARFVRLATWTAGPGTASHSFLLLLSWWAVCLYGYEILRYAPQAVLLSVLLFNGIVRVHKGVTNKPTSTPPRTITSHHINAIIDNLAELADFISTLSSTLLEPIFALLTWKSYERTKALTIFLVTTWPIWLLCFGRQIWDVLGLPRVAIEARKHTLQVVAVVSPTLMKQSEKLSAYGRQSWPRLFSPIDKLHHLAERAASIFSPILQRLGSWLSAFTSSDTLQMTILPPFPLFSLSVRHLLLVTGTLALTWCSPWCALIRHALWRSALVRQSTRKTIAVLCGQSPSSLYPPIPPSQGLSSTSTNFEKDPFTGQAIVDGPAFDTSEQIGKDFTRHEDVIYRFTVYENQRWWMGLDWTAALLPQERPSWADESNNPVSPPSSFSLPPAKTTLKAAPTSSNPGEYTKRLVRWQWIDAEWTVAGRESVGEALGLQTKSRRDSSASSITNSGTLFSNSTIGGSSEADAEDRKQRRSSTSSGMSATNASDLPSDLQLLDVDAEGWQYGDNSWEKMSRKSGLGRYTRRRRWIRRAVLVEIVQKHYVPTEQELKSDQELKEGTATKEEGTSPTSPRSPTSPSPSPSRASGDLKQRLSRAAQGANTTIV